MKSLALLPVAVLALAACGEAITDPTSVPIPMTAVVINSANAPNGTHFQAGTSAACAANQSGGITCSAYELAGVGNANATASLIATYSATVDCRNRGGQVVEVKASVQGATATTGTIEPKNGRLEVPSLSTGSAPSSGQFTAAATCPNGNWTKEVRTGTVAIESWIYTLTFAGFNAPYITITP